MKVRLVFLSLLALHSARAAIIVDPGQGIFDFTGPANGLSGITWIGGNTYYAVGDSEDAPNIFPLTVTHQPSGAVAGATLGSPFALATGADPEGIAYHPTRNSFFVSDETYPTGSHIREFDRSTGALLNTLEIPPVMLRDRQSLGFEALTLGAGAIWTANEQALEHESHPSHSAEGSLIRLQKFHDTSLAPAGQWAYRTDPSHGAPDLAALPDGRLLVLERSFFFGPGGTLHNRIYLVDFALATDTSAISDLDDGGFFPTEKTLLWEADMGPLSTHNFEGLAVGPQLGPDSLSLLLIADNHVGSTQHLYALTLRGIPEPGSSALVSATVALLANLRRRHPAPGCNHLPRPSRTQVDVFPATS